MPITTYDGYYIYQQSSFFIDSNLDPDIQA